VIVASEVIKFVLGVAQSTQGRCRDVEGVDPVSLIAYDKVMVTVDAVKKFEEAFA